MAVVRGGDRPERKSRGAFFTPPAIADYLAAWAVRDDPRASVLDPTCGEAVFLLAAARHLSDLGCSAASMRDQVFGVDLHEESLTWSLNSLKAEGLDAHLIAQDFFTVPTPAQLGCPLPEVDAVIGNPPFVRYQDHIGLNRHYSATAALAQGVRLSGLASSWAALLVHACAFLKPEGRLAMVLPAELLTVHYAEPVRRWLRNRFASVHLVMFERLQFEDALEKVVLVVARGSGGCDSFSLHYLNDADDLARLHAFDNVSATPAATGKWTDLWLTVQQRQLYKKVAGRRFVNLDDYGAPELGTVTGNNDFFTLSETTKQQFGLEEDQLLKVSPPGTRHLTGLTFSASQWNSLREQGEPVWLLRPEANDERPGLCRYITLGESLGVHQAYKCQIRTPWWRPPVVTPPDLFFTYMSHRYPRLITNSAGVTFVNSMHGVRLRPDAPPLAKFALPLLVLNSVTMLGAEVQGRSYGGGILKMEPREAAHLPVPEPAALAAAWGVLKDKKACLERQLRDGRWTNVAKQVDQVLLQDVMGLDPGQVVLLHEAARSLRERRIGPAAARDASA